MCSGLFQLFTWKKQQKKTHLWTKNTHLPSEHHHESGGEGVVIWEKAAVIWDSWQTAFWACIELGARTARSTPQTGVECTSGKSLLPGKAPALRLWLQLKESACLKCDAFPFKQKNPDQALFSPLWCDAPSAPSPLILLSRVRDQRSFASIQSSAFYFSAIYSCELI